MEDKELDTQDILNKVKDYIEVRKELAMLSAVEKGSQLFANLVTDGLVVLLLVLSGLFGSLALGFYLSEIIGNTYSGFLIITGFYFVLAIIIYATKDRYLEHRIISAVIKKFFRDRKTEEV